MTPCILYPHKERIRLDCNPLSPNYLFIVQVKLRTLSLKQCLNGENR